MKVRCIFCEYKNEEVIMLTRFSSFVLDWISWYRMSSTITKMFLMKIKLPNSNTTTYRSYQFFFCHSLHQQTNSPYSKRKNNYWDHTVLISNSKHFTYMKSKTALQLIRVCTADTKVPVTCIYFISSFRYCRHDCQAPSM